MRAKHNGIMRIKTGSRSVIIAFIGIKTRILNCSIATAQFRHSDHRQRSGRPHPCAESGANQQGRPHYQTCATGRRQRVGAGGIAAVLSEEDSPEAHIRDTLIAGAGLCNEAVTRYVVEEGPRAVQWLISQGVPFTRNQGSGTGYHLTREGGHSVRRVIHAADATGQAVQLTLIEKARTHPNITVLEHHVAIDLITSAKLGRADQ